MEPVKLVGFSFAAWKVEAIKASNTNELQVLACSTTVQFLKRVAELQRFDELCEYDNSFWETSLQPLASSISPLFRLRTYPSTADP